MRIISGTHKGRRIIAPKKLPIRPTTDMAKEGLFNVLNNRFFLDDISVLDLFSGSGNISYEFASRGCKSITSMDQNLHCVKFIQKTASELNMPINVLKADVFKLLPQISKKYDVVFADPPYKLDSNSFNNLLDLIFKYKILTKDGLLVVEHPKQLDMSFYENFDNKKTYGGNCFSFFENKKADL